MGKFHVCNAVCHFYNQTAARVDFMFAMAGLGRADGYSFPEWPANADWPATLACRVTDGYTAQLGVGDSMGEL